MAVVLEILALPFSAFDDPNPALTDRPGGNNPDTFRLPASLTPPYYQVSIDDDDGFLDEDSLVNEQSDDPNQIATVRDETGAVIAVDTVYVEWTATYTGNGQSIEVYRIELENGLRLFALSEPPVPGVTYFTNNKDQSPGAVAYGSVPSVPCFTEKTLIETPKGRVAIETLRAGDWVQTRDNGAVRLRWIGRRAVSAQDLRANPKLRPVRIMAGALGHGLPERDLLVSRQHRMLVCSRVAHRMFGSYEVLVAAHRLTGLPGIFVDEAVQSVTYLHLLFDDHEIVMAEGCASESLYLGPEAMKALSDDARDEVYALFPELRRAGSAPAPAREIPQAKRQKKLVERHLRNAVPMVSHLS